MKFCIDQDAGDAVYGWLVLDNPGLVPEVTVSAPGRPSTTIRATVDRPGIRDLGLHSTGLVGFVIDGTKFPGIDMLAEIEIREKETGTLIYKRFDNSKYCLAKIYYCDPSLMPQLKVSRKMLKHFASIHLNFERQAADTIQCLLYRSPDSIACSGTLNTSRYLQILKDCKFITTAILRDPYEELAEKLLFLQFIARSKNRVLLEGYVRGYEPLIDIAADLPVGDPAGQKRFFRGLTDDQKAILSNPWVRIFGCDPNENAAHRNVSVALNNLSQFDWVGARTNYPRYRAVLTEMLGVDVMPEEGFEFLGNTQEFAQDLVKAPGVMRLLDLDLALYSFVEEALEETATA